MIEAVIAANTRTQTAAATHTQTSAKSSIGADMAAPATLKLQAAYIPSGNTVAHRRVS